MHSKSIRTDVARILIAICVNGVMILPVSWLKIRVIKYKDDFQIVNILT